ncbi:MAG: hypothetical protein RL748_788 [Pseudomonadota bacterium]|jgi:pyruvate/2-oxoglutarate dehydrogenase complex dihydrolipoamide acyltransferase (E2) component
MSQIIPFPQHRRHTWFFLDHARSNAPILLDTEIDMSRIQALRARYKAHGPSPSYISFLIHAISQVVAQHPQANSSVKDGWSPSIIRYERVVAKFTLDKTGFGERMVLSALIADSNQKSVPQIQADIERYKAATYENSSEFAAVKKLNSVPFRLGRMLYGMVLGKLAKRQEIQGSFTITSLGHSRVQGFFPISSTTLAFGVGAIRDAAVVVDGQIVVRPMMRLSMVFDHRALDGALAADILHQIGSAIEQFPDQ